MARARKGPELRLSGSSLGTRFAMQMSLALAAVMIAAGLFLYDRTVVQAQRTQEESFIGAVKLRGNLLETRFARVKDSPVASLAGGEVERHEVQLATDATQKGQLYVHVDKDRHRLRDPGRFQDNRDYDAGYEDGYKDGHQLFVPATARDEAGKGLLGLIVGVTLCVMLVGAAVAWMVGNAVSRPLQMIVEDIAQVARGNLRHRTRVRAGGEIMLLAKSVDRLAGDLEAAQDAQLELSRRERELGLAAEVREALLPEGTPTVEGHEIGALHVDSPSPGGDFHDFVELADGRLALLVCEVSGRGIPGAMIGAIARSYLRVEIAAGGDLAAALSRVNRELARDVRRGMFVTALCAILEPRTGIATVACAGHKVPLVRHSATDGKIRLVQPEGIALGFDKGPVFDRALKVLQVPVEPGDRLVLANTGPVRVRNGAGEELGEKEFYRMVLQGAGHETAAHLKAIEQALGGFAGGEPFPNDISIVAVSRKP